MKPLIGIGCAWNGETGLRDAYKRPFNHIDTKYQEAVYRYGGIPVLLPPPRENDPDLDEYALEVLRHLDGLYMAGGGGGGRGKLDGKRYALYDQQPVRAAWEDCLIRHAYEMDIPTLGACRGHQMIAQALGGQIDPGSYPEHLQTAMDHEGHHVIYLDPDSRLAAIVGKEPWFVNSLHTQIVKTAPKGFRAGARTESGSIESIESIDKRFFMGTQFHPELMLQNERAKRLLTAFLAEAGRGTGDNRATI